MTPDHRPEELGDLTIELVEARELEPEVSELDATYEPGELDDLGDDLVEIDGSHPAAEGVEP